MLGKYIESFFNKLSHWENKAVFRSIICSIKQVSFLWLTMRLCYGLFKGYSSCRKNWNSEERWFGPISSKTMLVKLLKMVMYYFAFTIR